MRTFETVGINEAELIDLRQQLESLPNRVAQCAYLRQYQADNPAVDVRTIRMELRSDERKRQQGRRIVKQKSRNDPGQQAFSGDGSNMRCGTRGGGAFLSEQLWWAAVPSNRDGGLMEPVIGGLDQMPGKYGTNTQFLQTPESFTGLVG